MLAGKADVSAFSGDQTVLIFSPPPLLASPTLRSLGPSPPVMLSLETRTRTLVVSWTRPRYVINPLFVELTLTKQDALGMNNNNANKNL